MAEHQMNVIRVHGVRDLRLHNETIPTPSSEDERVRVRSVGICGSDLHWYAEAGIGDTPLERPIVLGHEFAGRLPGGELVAVDPAIACGGCEFCLEGNPNFCTALHFAGTVHDDGALQEYVVWPRTLLHVLPDTFSADEGSMLEPLGVAIHAVDLAHMRAGNSVAIFGSGPIGLLLIQVARAAGSGQIFATDPLPHRLDAALQYGATDVFQTDAGNARTAIWSATRERGVDVSFEAAGENDALEAAIHTCKRGGRVMVVGIPSVDQTTFSAAGVRHKGLTLKWVRRMKHTYPRAIQLVESGQVDVGSMVTHHFSLEDYEAAFDLATRREGLKVVIDV